jgi:hypothetical protein
MGKFAADRPWTQTLGERSDGAWGVDHLYHLDLDEKSHGAGNCLKRANSISISSYRLPGRALEHRLHAGLSEMRGLTQNAWVESGHLRRNLHSSEELLTISRRAGRGHLTAYCYKHWGQLGVPSAQKSRNLAALSQRASRRFRG